MKVELDGDEIVIRIKTNSEKKPSASGKTLQIASSGGNKPTELEVDGKTLYVGVNAYINNK